MWGWFPSCGSGWRLGDVLEWDRDPRYSIHMSKIDIGGSSGLIYPVSCETVQEKEQLLSWKEMKQKNRKITNKKLQKGKDSAVGSGLKRRIIETCAYPHDVRIHIWLLEGSKEARQRVRRNRPNEITNNSRGGWSNNPDCMTDKAPEEWARTSAREHLDSGATRENSFRELCFKSRWTN